MKPVSLLFSGAAVWECVRFILVLVYLSELAIIPAGRAVIVWFSSPQLVLAAAFVLVAAGPDRYRAYRPIIVLGKCISVVAGILALTVTLRSALGFAAGQVSPVVLAGVVGTDLIVLTACVAIGWGRQSSADEMEEEHP